MARQLRLQYEGAIYHITVRGNGRRRMFLDDRDRERFLWRLCESRDLHEVRIYTGGREASGVWHGRGREPATQAPARSSGHRQRDGETGGSTGEEDPANAVGGYGAEVNFEV